MKFLVLCLASLILLGCNAGKNQTNIELIRQMMDQISLKAQDYQPEFGQQANRVPPEGTVARNREHYPYWDADPVVVGQKLSNPLPINELMDRGQEKYRVYCGLCHGQTGAGEGQIAEFMALKPPSLLTDKIRNYPDGRLFHIITVGQGVMGSYANQVFDSKDRWAIVNYVRKLQKENGGN